MKRRTEEPFSYGDARCKHMTAAILCRKSTATEGKSKSLDEQLELGRIDAARFGFGRVLEFIEPEGCKGEWYWRDAEGRFPPPYRHELGKLVELIEAGEVHAVIGYKLNRIVRDNGVEDALGRILRRHKVHLLLGGRDVGIDTARGKCDNATEAARAREWRDQISEDIGRDHDYKFEQGLFTRNPACYGFRSKGRGTQAVEFKYEELENVRKIFEWFVGWAGSAELGPYQIADKCMAQGIILAVGAKGHKARNPNKVHSTQIVSILENPMYMGEWQHRGERKPYPQLLVPPLHGVGNASPVIPLELWHRAQAKLALRSKCGRKSSDRLLAGMVICGACGRPCHVNTKYLSSGGRTLRWICPYRTGRLRSCFGDSYASVVVEELDSWVSEYVAPMMQIELEDILHERSDSALNREFAEAERLLATCRRKSAVDLNRALGSMDKVQFDDLAENLKEERLTLERRVSELSRLVRDDVDGYGGGNPSELLSENRSVLRSALRRYVRWIAITRNGVIVHTTMDTYVGGRYRERDLTIYSESDNRRTVEPPDFDAADTCCDWIGDKRAFVDGRRYALGPSAAQATSHQLLSIWPEEAA